MEDSFASLAPAVLEGQRIVNGMADILRLYLARICTMGLLIVSSLVIGFFPLLSKNAGELVVGEDDRHLDFRVALLLRTGAAGGRELVVVTVVHCHNWLGRTYLAAIAPFHRVIARASLEQAARAVEG